MVLAVVAGLAPAFSGCGDSAQDGAEGTARAELAWIDLTRGYEPAFEADDGREPSDDAIQLVERSGALTALIPYRRSDWSSTAIPGLFVADLRVPRSFVEGSRATRQQLAPESRAGTRGEPYGFARSIDVGSDWTRVPPGSFGTESNLVGLFLGPGVEPPARVVHRVEIPVGSPEGAGWRLTTNRWSGAGFLTPPRRAQRIELDAAWTQKDTTLRATFFALTPWVARDGTDPRLEVRVDGRAAESFQLDARAAASDGTALRFAVDVPRGARRIDVRYDGPLGLAGLLEPVLAPRTADVEALRARDERPDLVLFVADTLRADALVRRRVYADSHDVELPHLARLADESTEFDRAWSTSTWTLPAHASMLTGLLPQQHGAVGEFTQLAPTATTIAEVLGDSGYRTIAVTDGIYVSAEYGLDQGFASFDQTHGPRADPLARARAALEQRDGRPTFLFVHTYVAHTPYDPSAAALRAVGIEPPVDWMALDAELTATIDATTKADDLTQVPIVQRVRNVYDAALLDFDAELGAFVAGLDAHGWSERGVLVFTSDHGEAFGDHRQMFHGGELYETQTRIPLLVRGAERRGLAPGPTDVVASLVDLPRTFADLANADADLLAGAGRSLLSAAEDGAAWMSIVAGERIQLGLATGGSKRIEMVGEPQRATYDLTRDPDELEPLKVVPAQLNERWRSGVDAALERRLEPPLIADPSAELLERLRAMGYLDDD